MKEGKKIMINSVNYINIPGGLVMKGGNKKNKKVKGYRKTRISELNRKDVAHFTSKLIDYLMVSKK